MVAKSTDKQITFFLDEQDRDQWNKLCKTTGMSSSLDLRCWVLAALKNQKNDVEVAPEPVTYSATQVVDNSKVDGLITALMQRVDTLERQQGVLEQKDLDFIKYEVLGDAMGTIRNRIGVCETQLQSLGGSIAWERVVEDVEKD